MSRAPDSRSSTTRRLRQRPGPADGPGARRAVALAAALGVLLGLAACAGAPPAGPPEPAAAATADAAAATEAAAAESLPAEAAAATAGASLGTGASTKAPAITLAAAGPDSARAVASDAGSTVGTSIAAITGADAGVAADATQPPTPGFFITSRSLGNGGDLGGLEGADRHCQALAAEVGLGHRSWRAYLSASDTGRQPAVHARDRIGAGPWYNVRGTLIASSVEDLHESNNLDKDTALTETGEIVSGRGDPVNSHDILTGSSPAGRALQAEPDATCRNWTSWSEGSAVVGHHDRLGLNDEPPARSWNASHRSRGCSLDALRQTGGDGRLYCFAAD